MSTWDQYESAMQERIIQAIYSIQAARNCEQPMNAVSRYKALPAKKRLEIARETQYLANYYALDRCSAAHSAALNFLDD